MHATYLAMFGEVGWSASIRVAALALCVALSALLIPVYGAVGAAAAILATRVAVNALGAVLAYRLTGFLVVDPGLRAQPKTNFEISIAYDACEFVLHDARDRKASPALVRSTSPAKPSVS